MKALLGDDYKRFAAAYNASAYRGIRINTLKCGRENAPDFFDALKSSPFCPDGYYIESALEGIGNHPLHHAGAFYVQEPSATSAVTILDVKPGDRVLDLCAAPGGKSSQIAAALNGEGVLMANEYVLSRARILSQNLERMGVKNAVITSNRPDEICLQPQFEGYFNKVLVDAPCSGEGMFRKNPEAVKMWSEQAVKDCAKRQALILESAKRAVAPGGTLVYSTCTFSPEENEMQIDDFLKRNPDFELADCGVKFGSVIPNGRIKGVLADAEKMRRVFPFDGGEGHFAAKLIKKTDTGGYAPGGALCARRGQEYKYNCTPQEEKLFLQFWQDNFTGAIPGEIVVKRDRIYIPPRDMPDVSGLNVIRAGVSAARLCKNRAEPEHGIYMSCRAGDVKNRVELTADAPEAAAFLKGAEIPCDKSLKGFAGVFINGVSAGFGKASGGRLKNHYPKGLRIIG